MAITEECIRKLNLAIPLTSYLKAAPKNPGEYNCPFCGSEHHVKIFPDNNIGACARCGNNFNLLQAVEQAEGVDFLEAAALVSERAGIPLEYDRTENTRPQNARTATKQTADNKIYLKTKKALEMENNEPAEETERKANTPGLFRDFIEQSAADLFQPGGAAALNYLHSRGLDNDIIKKYKIGFSAEDVYFPKAKNNLPAVIFPHSGNYSYFSARSLEGKYFCKPAEKDAGKQPLYNPGALTKDRPCFICEGQLDALSIIQSGGAASALCGMGQDVLIEFLENNAPQSVLILSLDNDPADDSGKSKGQDAQEKLAAELKKRHIPFIAASYTGKGKDPNDLLQADPEQLRRDVEENEERARQALKPDNTKDYIAHTMDAEIKKLQRDAGRITGFANLDDELGCLYSGLYIVGGTSSVGKTTFAYQLADQLAEKGEHVLYFTLEQSRLELVSKSISRNTAILDLNKAVFGINIRTGEKSALITRATNSYIEKVGDRVSIIEGNYDCNVNFINDYIDSYIAHNGARPTVIVDYLQVLNATADPATGRKSTEMRLIVNENLTELKRISRRYEIPVIALSSLNRMNYIAPLDFESFKESGNIEYTADVVLGLQLTAIHGDLFSDKDTTQTKKREELAKAKDEIPRNIELVCLKNRFGKRFSCTFKYYLQYDYFIPTDVEGNDYKTKEVEFEQIPYTQKTIFD